MKCQHFRLKVYKMIIIIFYEVAGWTQWNVKHLYAINFYLLVLPMTPKVRNSVYSAAITNSLHSLNGIWRECVLNGEQDFTMYMLWGMEHLPHEQKCLKLTWSFSDFIKLNVVSFDVTLESVFN